jgi:hypothetical protein
MDHRRFSRILFSSDARLITTQDHQTLQFKTEVLDLSLKGALVKRPEHWHFPDGTMLTLEFLLNDSELILQMDAVLAHSHQDSLGLRCEKIDIESASHLRRLLELNLGDADLLSRELSELSN